jgi:hypothetical protein
MAKEGLIESQHNMESFNIGLRKRKLKKEL